MIETCLLHLEGGGHVEDLLAVLDGDHAAAREALAVAAAVDVIDDGRVAVAAPQKVGMQRVHHASVRHSGGRRPQGLAQHLAAKELWATDVLTTTAKEIYLERLELEHSQQLSDTRVSRLHGRTARAQTSLDDEVAVHKRIVTRERAQILVRLALLQS
jgi:hypothetical protein